MLFHVQPNAKRTEVVGWHGDAIKVRVRAPPVDGAANEELIRFVAERLGLQRTAVRIVSGKTSRRKRLSLERIDQPQVLRALHLEADWGD
jgi:uncharacterized protein (TIGR00251 family)